MHTIHTMHTMETLCIYIYITTQYILHTLSTYYNMIHTIIRNVYQLRCITYYAYYAYYTYCTQYHIPHAAQYLVHTVCHTMYTYTYIHIRLILSIMIILILTRILTLFNNNIHYNVIGYNMRYYTIQIMLLTINTITSTNTNTNTSVIYICIYMYILNCTAF